MLDILGTFTGTNRNLSRILSEVAAMAGVSQKELVGPRRDKRLVRPRQLAMAVARTYTDASLPEIGRVFHRDHTTVIHAISAVEKWGDETTKAIMETVARRAGLTPAQKWSN